MSRLQASDELRGDKKMRLQKIMSLLAVSLTSSACTQNTSSATAPAFRPTASIQDLMAAEVDPAADFIWESVSSESSVGHDEDKQPRTQEEWLAVRHQAIVLIEATNLLLMEGRQVAVHGKLLEDADVPGISKPEEIQKAIEDDRPSFVKFVHALNDAGVQILTAVDTKNVSGLVEAGDVLDKACENCHLKYWYPNSPRP